MPGSRYFLGKHLHILVIYKKNKERPSISVCNSIFLVYVCQKVAADIEFYFHIYFCIFYLNSSLVSIPSLYNSLRRSISFYLFYISICCCFVYSYFYFVFSCSMRTTLSYIWIDYLFSSFMMFTFLPSSSKCIRYLTVSIIPR